MPAPRRPIAVSSGRAHGFESIFAAPGNLLLQPIEPAHPSLISLVSARRSEEHVRGEVAKATDNPLLGLGSNPGVNILKLNLALDALTPKSGLAEKKP